jgi:hypothetical protein
LCVFGAAGCERCLCLVDLYSFVIHRSKHNAITAVNPLKQGQGTTNLYLLLFLQATVYLSNITLTSSAGEKKMTNRLNVCDQLLWRNSGDQTGEI